MALNVICCETAKRLEVGGKAEVLGARSKRRVTHQRHHPAYVEVGLLSGISDLSTFVPFLSAFRIAFLSFFSFFFFLFLFAHVIRSLSFKIWPDPQAILTVET